MPTSSIPDRVCVVTGAANGLGAAMACGLAKAGARVVLADIDEPGLRRTSASIEAACGRGRALVVHADATDETAMQRVVDTAMRWFGCIEVIVNNAGTGAQIVREDFISRPLKSWEVPPDKWRRIIEVNAIGPFLLSRAAIPHLLERGWGRIVNVSTTWETMLRPGFASYGSSKAALEAMSCSMARELEGTGITVNTVLPGGPADTAQVPADIGVDRALLLRPEVMTPVMVWLASDASAGITGQRFTAARWEAERDDAANLRAASEPAAWPQLIEPIVMRARGNLR